MKILNEIYEIIKDKEFTDEECINEDFELDYIKGDEYNE